MSTKECFTVEVVASGKPLSDDPQPGSLHGFLRISIAGGGTTEYLNATLFDMITALSYELKKRLEASAISQGLMKPRPTISAGPARLG